MDATAATLNAELSLEIASVQVSQQEAHLASVEIMATEKREERDALAAELAAAEAERAAGRAAIDALHQEHEARVAAAQSDLDEIARRSKEKQLHTTLLQQHMATLSAERHTLTARHDDQLQSMAHQAKAFDAEQAARAQTQAAWILEQQQEHERTHERLKEMQAKLAAAKQQTGQSLAAGLADAQRPADRSTCDSFRSRVYFSFSLCVR